MSWLRLIRGSDAAVNLPETTTRPSVCVVSHRVPDTQWELIAWERMDCVCYKLLVCLNNGPGVPVVASKAGYPDARYWPTGVMVTDAAMQRDLHAICSAIERGVHEDKKARP